jgi:hypothetical protein
MSETAITYVAPSFEWTDDCQGKKDYDGPLLSVSTRYWPPSYSRDGQHSASASILWGDPATEYTTIAEHEFFGDTLDEVKQFVEAWVAEQSRVMFDRIMRAGVEW